MASTSSQLSTYDRALQNTWQPDLLTIAKREPDLVLLIFIHGFKGTDESFCEFPQRLQHLLSETLDNATVESIVFPAYEVRLSVLTSHFDAYLDWSLQTKGELVSPSPLRVRSF